MKKVMHGEITSAVESFLRWNGEQPSQRHGRERSWDFCFNHFQLHDEPSQEMELSCLQLGYYLASWGMLRGSSYLFRETNARHYRPTIAIIERYNPQMRKIDAQQYLEPAVQEF